MRYPHIHLKEFTFSNRFFAFRAYETMKEACY